MASLLADSQKPVMTVPSPVAIVNAQTIVLTTPQQQQIQQQQQQQQPLPVVSATVVQQIQPQKGLSLTVQLFFCFTYSKKIVHLPSSIL